MSFIRKLFIPKVKAAKQDYRFGSATTKLVGKPLGALYGTALVRGNVVYSSTTADLTKSDTIAAMCWGPVTFNKSSLLVNRKRPRVIDGVSPPESDKVDVRTYTGEGRLGQLPISPIDGSLYPKYGLNRTAYVRIVGKASETYGGFDQLEVLATRPPLFVSTGLSAHYNTPIPPQIAARWPGGLPSHNPIAAALDYLLNLDYGAGRPIGAFGDFSTWIQAINWSGIFVTLPDGRQEIRHQIGTLVGEQEGSQHADIVETLLEMGDAKPFESGGIIKVWQPRPSDYHTVVAALDRSNFNPTSAEFADLQDIPNFVEVRYDNDDNGNRQPVSWDDPDSLASHSEIRKTFDYPAISSATMASRKARLIGRRAIAESLKIEGDAHHRYRLLEPGDLVSVTAGDESGEWLQEQKFWVDSVERINTDKDFGVRLALIQYGGDALYDDGHASELDRNDPILRSPISTLPDPRGEPQSIEDVAAEVHQFSDQDGKITHVVTLTWPEPEGEPHYMHDRYNVYRRDSLGAQWKFLGSTTAALFRDDGAPIVASDLYYGVVGVTSSQSEGALPALYSVKVDRQRGPAPVDPSSITVTVGNRLTTANGLVTYLDVSWSHVLGAVRYELYYRYNGGANIYVDQTTGDTLRIDGVNPGSYTLTVVAIGANGQTSNMATTTYTLSDSHYDGPEPITNLRIGGYVGTSPGQFLGRDIVLKWNAPASAAFFNPSFQDYAIEVLIGLTTVNVAYVTDPTFTYTYEANWRDNKVVSGNDYPSRVVTFRVRTRDRSQRLSTPVQLTASNPQTPVAASIEVDVAFKVGLIKATPQAGEPDIAGMRVVAGDNISFAPSTAGIIYDGETLLASLPVEPGVTRFIRVALYDSFGPDSLNWSSSFNFTGHKLVSEEIAEGAIRANNIADEVFDAFEAIDSATGVSVVLALPALPDTSYPEGKYVHLTSDGKLYRNVNSVWTRSVDGGDIIANSIVAGTLKAGAVQADALAANAVTAKAMAIGNFDNMCQDPIFAVNSGYWIEEAASTATYEYLTYDSTRMASNCPAARGLRINSDQSNGGYAGIYMPIIDVEVGDKYYGSCYATSGGTARPVYISAAFYDRTGTFTSFSEVNASGQATPAVNNWIKIQDTFTVPAGSAKMQMFMAYGPGTSGRSFFTLARLRKMTGSVLIEDGAITSDKIVAAAITADKLTAESVTADKIAAGSIIAGKIAADAITAANIRVGIITADKIVDLSLTTPKIAGNAITSVQYAYLGGLNINSNDNQDGSYPIVGSFTTSESGQGRLILTLCSRDSDGDELVYVKSGPTDNYSRAYIYNNLGQILWDSGTRHDNENPQIVTIPRSLTLFNQVTPGVAVAYAIAYYAQSNPSGIRRCEVRIRTMSVMIQEVKR